MAHHCPGRRQPRTSQGKGWTSWRFNFRRRRVSFSASLDQWLQTDKTLLKIKSNAEMAKKVPPQDTALVESRRLVNWFQIKDRSTDAFAAVSSEGHSRQSNGFDVFRNSGGAEDSHSSWFQKGLHFIQSGQLFRNDCDTGAG